MLPQNICNSTHQWLVASTLALMGITIGCREGLQAEIPTGCLRPGTHTDTLSHPYTHMHTPAHNKWLYGQSLDSVGSKAQKLTLSQRLGSKDSGVLNQALTYVSPLLWANHFNIIPPGFTHQLYGHAALNVCKVLCNVF